VSQAKATKEPLKRGPKPAGDNTIKFIETRPNSNGAVLRRLARDCPEMTQQRIADEVGVSRQYAHEVLSSKSFESKEVIDMPEHGEIGNGRKDESRPDNVMSTKYGNDTTYTLRRLARDNPELLDKIEAGELSVNQAVIKDDAECLAMFRKAMKEQGRRTDLGDNVTEVKPQDKGNSKAYTCKLFGIEYQTANRAAGICRAFTQSKRQRLLSFEHHKEVAGREDKAELLQWAIESEDRSSLLTWTHHREVASREDNQGEFISSLGAVDCREGEG
jgi:hypothetical protein